MGWTGTLVAIDGDASIEDVTLELAGHPPIEARRRPDAELLDDQGNRWRIDCRGAAIEGSSEPVAKGAWSRVAQDPRAALVRDTRAAGHVETALTWRGLRVGDRVTVEGEEQRDGGSYRSEAARRLRAHSIRPAAPPHRRSRRPALPLVAAALSAFAIAAVAATDASLALRSAVVAALAVLAVSALRRAFGFAHRGEGFPRYEWLPPFFVGQRQPSRELPTRQSARGLALTLATLVAIVGLLGSRAALPPTVVAALAALLLGISGLVAWTEPRDRRSAALARILRSATRATVAPGAPRILECTVASTARSFVSPRASSVQITATQSSDAASVITLVTPTGELVVPLIGCAWASESVEETEDRSERSIAKSRATWSVRGGDSVLVAGRREGNRIVDDGAETIVLFAGARALGARRALTIVAPAIWIAGTLASIAALVLA